MANLDALLTTAERQVPGWTMLMMRFAPVRTDPSPFLFPSPARRTILRARS